MEVPTIMLRVLKPIIFILALAFCLSPCVTIQAAPGISQTSTLDSLNVYFFDVGEGDSILIDCGSNEVLIDGGEKSSNVTNLLKSYVQGPIEDVIATHMDADHIGGLTEVVNSFNISNIWTNGDTSTSQTYKNFMTAVNTSRLSTLKLRIKSL
jgi:competence protein ComEC